MKLVQRTSLHFQEGNSDKVYEVDLCETGAGRYVVNFRYGRRGAALQEGTKTNAPVSLSDAEKAFQGLVAEKTKKGYRATSETAPAPVSVTATPKEFDHEARKQRILQRLEQTPPPPRPPLKPAKNSWQRPERPKQTKGVWPIERVIWRSGELKIEEAAPLLPKFIGTGDALRDYCVAWALGHCGAGDTDANAALTRLYQSPATPGFVRGIAGEALFKLSDEATRLGFQIEAARTLPAPLEELSLNGPAESFAAALPPHLSKSGALLETIYAVNNENVRPALLQELNRVPLRPGFFRPLRYIFKMAEYRGDGEVLGLLAYRFEKGAAMFNNSGYWSENIWGYADGDYLDEKISNLGNDDAKAAYSSRTRDYLRRRARRTLRKLGEDGDAGSYVKMAVGALLPYTDADAQEPRETVQLTYYNPKTKSYDWNNPQKRVTRYDAFAPYLLFNQLLYQNSARYELKPNNRAWRCASGYKAGQPAPSFREEAFPALWDAQPVGLLHLLAESACRPVHEFAVRALREQTDFVAQLDADTVVMLLERPYDVTAQFAFALAQTQFARLPQDSADAFRLALAVAVCAYEEARREGQRWLYNLRERLARDADAIARLLASEHRDARECGAELLAQVRLSDAEARPVLVRLLAYLLTLKEGQDDTARALADAIKANYAPPLRGLGFAVVRDLLAHPLEAAQKLGAFVLLNHETPAAEMPGDLVAKLIAAPFASVRTLGVQLFGRMPDETLLRSTSTIASLLAHTLTDIHDAARPTARRLAMANLEFARELTLELVGRLLQTEAEEGIHNRLLRVLAEDVPHWETHTNTNTARDLIAAPTPAAQEAGGRLLENRATDWRAAFATEDIVNLSEHEIRAVRVGAWALGQAGAARFRVDDNGDAAHEEVAQLTRALDAKWDDAREFWQAFFRREMSVKELTPDVLTGICDSVKPTAQAFGRELLQRYFQEENGADLMLRLSEHPTAEMQLFVTNYLENYATDNPERLARLKPYFVSALSLVNRGRTAKDRIFRFLRAEAAKSPDAARIAGEILARQSATCAKGDKATAIELMLELRQKYPFLQMPLQVKTASVL